MFSSNPAFEPGPFIGKRVPRCPAYFLLKEVRLEDLVKQSWKYSLQKNFQLPYNMPYLLVQHVL